MAIQVKIGTHTTTERLNEYLPVIDALITEDQVRAENAKGGDYLAPNATFAVPSNQVGSIKRQMRDAAHLRDKTARLTHERDLPAEKGKESETELTYILQKRTFRKNKGKTEE